MNAMDGGKNAAPWMRVLGIDPAAAGPTGYGVVDSDGRHCRMLHYGALRVPAARQKESSGAALQDIHELVCRLIQEFAPTVMAVESVFTALNMRTALRLAEVRGVLLLAAAQHGLAVHSYSPREIKASVAGYGHADKRQMQLMVRALLSMTETPEPTDAADALAVALCHLQAEQARVRYGGLRRFRHGKQRAYHQLHLPLIGVAVARNGSFDFARRVAVHRQAVLRSRQQEHAAHLRQAQCCAHI